MSPKISYTLRWWNIFVWLRAGRIYKHPVIASPATLKLVLFWSRNWFLNQEIFSFSFFRQELSFLIFAWFFNFPTQIFLRYHLVDIIAIRGGVEDTRLEAKDTKKIRGQGQGQPFRGQNLSRPRTGMLEAKDTGASVLQKKKVFKNFYQAISNSLAYPEFLIGGGLNHKSHEMTSSKFFQRGCFCGTKIS